MWLSFLAIFLALPPPSLPNPTAPVLVVNPGHLIDGDEITVHVWTGGGDDCRITGQPKVLRKGHTFSVDPRVEGKCSGEAAHVVSLGKLDAGAYAVSYHGHTVPFLVEPAGTDPGDLEEELRLKVAVIQALGAPGRGFGMPPARPYHFPTTPWTQLALRRMAKAHPGLSPKQLRELLGAALEVGMTAAGKDRWIYSFTDGQFCSISQKEGQVTRDRDGRLTVSPATVTHHESVPC